MEKPFQPLDAPRTRAPAAGPEAVTRPGVSELYGRVESWLLPLVLGVSGLSLWEAIAASGWVNPLLISSPSRIYTAAVWLFANGFSNDIWISAQEFGIGFGLALATGLPLGLVLGWYRRPRLALEPFIAMVYSLPRVALMPVILLWLGIGIESKVAVVYLGAVFPIVITVMTGLKLLDPLLMNCARAFGANDRQLFLTLALPGTVPFILAGMRLGVGRALVGVVVGELIASTGGVGHMMSKAGATFQVDKVFVGVLLLAGAGWTLTEGLNWAERRLDRWRVDRRG
jgi:ABC-type nitrate/sulfonate/bicarbonate transport system permease component